MVEHVRETCTPVAESAIEYACITERARRSAQSYPYCLAFPIWFVKCPRGS